VTLAPARIGASRSFYGRQARDEGGNVGSTASLYGYIAMFYAERGERSHALDVARAGITIATEIGDLTFAATALEYTAVTLSILVVGRELPDLDRVEVVGPAGVGDELPVEDEPDRLAAQWLQLRHAWERDASLRLRAGDLTVLDEYAAEHRIHEGDRRAGERWALGAGQIDRRHGRTVALMAPTNDTVVRLNRLAQRARLAAGELGDRTLKVGPFELRVGDEIATRRNDRQLRTDQGLMVKNRDSWTITDLHRSGAPTATGRSGTVRLPARYVREHVGLAYAQTSHAAQGRTLDRSLLVLDGTTDVRGIYVSMSRGRASNDVFVVTDGTRTARDVLNEALTHDWIDTPGDGPPD
jgi:hypothetical protein